MRSLNDYFLTAEIADVSTAGQVYIPVPDDGKIIKVITALGGAITTADATVTVKTAQGTAGTITVAFTSSAAGDVDTLEPTSNHAVLEGGTIEVETDGGSTGTAQLGITVVVRR